ncbi:dTDP-4-dehydrorhamnose reductase [Mucilaginibacter sabulilitoris]|uniref:dTDP-4-dehydrorhamnose reductase n=1 Tax=Mucilaginibacter sabulilitoris TaxID=1173583 RepID=A0ABZ0TUS4_9SPHI|nr:dTDP-4-dehydrorhamnose reductase [Mucilaginibacter sabulilitoris]WPU95823.1 dTDP-4-dehydrorhamnose reductase [Mucilaginibacter sabulilitoris]
MQNIIVFGASGQLGHCLKAVAASKQINNIFFPPEGEANILDADALSKLFEQYKPAYAINCAAYTAVDKAEDDIDIARKINRTGAANLAAQCKNHDTVLVHISTDFVFKGDKPYPLVESDVAEPISVYGLTKLEGEQDIVDILPRHYILRTSWLYSEYGNNFVKTMLKLGADREELKIIADQIGSPTYGIDLAAAILDIITSDSERFGIYHYSNEGVTSWYDFAKGIFDLVGSKVKVYPIRTSEYPTKATRPAFSVMDKAKIKSTFNIQIPYWRDSLIVCLERLK